MLLEFLPAIIIVGFPLSGFAGFLSRVRYVESSAKEWMALSNGTKKLISPSGDSENKDKRFYVKPSVQYSSFLYGGVTGEHHMILCDFIPEDLKYIEECRENGTLDQAYKKTGMYPERIKGLLEYADFHNIPDDEWELIHEFYRQNLNRRLAQANQNEITAERISAGYHSDNKRVLSTDIARKQLRQSPEQQWTEQYAKDAELTR